LFRVGRVVVITYGVYQCGYQSGLADAINDPLEVSQTLMQVVLKAQNATGESTDAEMKRRSRLVGKRVVASGRDYCAQKQRAAELIFNQSSNEEESVPLQEEVEKWRRPVYMLQHHEWSFIVIDAPSVNAFVHDLQPGKIFIHQGLFERVSPTDDELALILCHELSHLIHAHGTASADITLFVSIVQLALFSLVDPSGLLPFLFDIMVKQFGNIFEKVYSREFEEEADLTGIEICALACFDTKNACQVFGRLNGDGGDNSATEWNSTHPSSSRRMLYLQEASLLHNPEAHGVKCEQMKSFLIEMRKLLGRGL